MKCNLQNPACLSCSPLVLIPSERCNYLPQTWEMAPCHSPLQNRYNPSSISQVQGLGWALAELGHCTPGIFHPQVLGLLCKQNTCEVHPATRQDGWRAQRLQEKMLGALCCGQDIPTSLGTHPAHLGQGLPGARQIPRDESSGSHRFRTQAVSPHCFSFSAMYHAIAIQMQSIYSLHNFNYF